MSFVSWCWELCCFCTVRCPVARLIYKWIFPHDYERVIVSTEMPIVVTILQLLLPDSFSWR